MGEKTYKKYNKAAGMSIDEALMVATPEEIEILTTGNEHDVKDVFLSIIIRGNTNDAIRRGSGSGTGKKTFNNLKNMPLHKVKANMKF